jgi:PAS domain S-box-containing protein
MHRRCYPAGAATVGEMADDDRQQVARLRHLFETITDVVSYRYRVEPTPGYEYISANCVAMIGYSAEEFYEDPDLWQKLVHPDDVDALQLMFIPGSGPITVRWRTRWGDERWALQSASVIQDTGGSVVAFEGLVYDITRRVRLEEERRQRGFELHNEVVQGLAVARLAFDVDDRSRLDHSLTETLEAARRLVEELLGPGTIDAGDLRQSQPDAPA